jgi:hypothetical protein
MLMVLGQENLAKSLTATAFNYYYDKVKSRVQQKESLDGFELYMLRQSTTLLNNLGETSYVNKFDPLRL